LVREVDQDYRIYQDFIVRVGKAYLAFDPDTFTLDDWTNIMDNILPITQTWRAGLDHYFEEEPYDSIPDWIFMVEEFIRRILKKE